MDLDYLLLAVVIIGGIALAYFATKRILADNEGKSRSMRRWERRRKRRKASGK